VECERLRKGGHPYQSACYLPYAIADETSEKKLFVTESPWCCSLLEPNTAWLERFSPTYSKQFKVTSFAEVQTTTLDEIPELDEVDVDIIKSDSQGLEIPIFLKGKKLLSSAFAVETENGFQENYKQESTYAQVDMFMREQGFMLFDMELHRVAREESFDRMSGHLSQPMWATALWLKDYIGLDAKGEKVLLTEAKACKVLELACFFGAVDYALELEPFFRKKGFLVESLKSGVAREVFASSYKDGGMQSFEKALSLGLRIFPKRWRQILRAAASDAAGKNHLLNR